MGKSTLPHARDTCVIARCVHVETARCNFIHVLQQPKGRPGQAWEQTMHNLHTCTHMMPASCTIPVNDLVTIVLRNIAQNTIKWCSTISAEDCKGALCGALGAKGPSIVARISQRTLSRVACEVRARKLGTSYEVTPPRCNAPLQGVTSSKYWDPKQYSGVTGSATVTGSKVQGPAARGQGTSGHRGHSWAGQRMGGAWRAGRRSPAQRSAG